MVEVVGALVGEAPVRHPPQRGQSIAPQPGGALRREQMLAHPHGQDHHRGSRQQPPCAPRPERRQLHPPRAVLLLQQQRRDQEAAQHEEHVNADEPPRQARHTSMIGQHRQYRQRPHPIEARDLPVPHGDCPRRHPMPTPRSHRATHIQCRLPTRRSEPQFIGDHPSRWSSCPRARNPACGRQKGRHRHGCLDSADYRRRAAIRGRWRRPVPRSATSSNGGHRQVVAWPRRAHRRPTGLRGWPTSSAAPCASCGSSGTGARPHSPTVPA